MLLLPSWSVVSCVLLFVCLSFYFYVPPTIVEGHYVFWSVRWFVRSSVRSSARSFVRLFRSRLKFLVKVVFDEIEVQSTWNLVHMFPLISILLNEETSFVCRFSSFHNKLIIMPLCPIGTMYCRIYHPFLWLYSLGYLGRKSKKKLRPDIFPSLDEIVSQTRHPVCVLFLYFVRTKDNE